MAKNQSSQEATVAAQKKKSEAFKKLAVVRVNRAIAALNKVAALANKRSYVYDAAQVEKIDQALGEAYKGVGTAFSSGKSADGFTL